jgi:IPTL-CTERM motif
MKTIAVFVLFAVGIAPAYAGMFRISTTSVPTLDEGGLIALIALVGVVGGLIARRRKK